MPLVAAQVQAKTTTTPRAQEIQRPTLQMAGSHVERRSGRINNSDRLWLTPCRLEATTALSCLCHNDSQCNVLIICDLFCIVLYLHIIRSDIQRMIQCIIYVFTNIYNIITVKCTAYKYRLCKSMYICAPMNLHMPYAPEARYRDGVAKARQLRAVFLMVKHTTRMTLECR